MWRGTVTWMLAAAMALGVCAGPVAAQNAGRSGGGEAAVNGEATPAPAAAAPVDPDYESPVATVATFIEAMDRYTDELAAGNDLAARRALERAASTLALTEPMRERARTLAAKLMGVLSRLGPMEDGLLWDAEQAATQDEQTLFPHGSFGPVLARNPEVEPRGSIVLKRRPDGRWLFSEDTLAGIDELFRSVETMPPMYGRSDRALRTQNWLRAQMPTTLKHNTLLTVEYWQWIGLLVLIFVGVAVDRLSRVALRLGIAALMRRRGLEPNVQRIRQFVRPAGLVAMSVFWLATLWTLELPGTAYTVVFAAARVFGVLAITWALWRLTDLVADALMDRAAATSTKFDDVFVPMIHTTLRIFIVVFGIIYGGLALNINIWPAITALGIAGVGFGFAAKDTLENFFGSATVLIDRPFGVGDWIAISDIDVEGTVEQIGFRSTRVRTFYNSLITVPNANLVRASVDNYGRRKYRRWKTDIGVQYDTTPERLVAFCEGIRELVRTHPFTRKDYFQVYLNGFGASSLNILVYVFHETPDWSTELRERERLMLDIIRLADALGVQFAFPTQTLHVFNESHDAAHTPSQTPTSLTDKRAAVKGIRATQQLIANQTWQKDKPGAVEFKFGPTQIDDSDETQIEQRDAGG